MKQLNEFLLVNVKNSSAYQFFKQSIMTFSQQISKIHVTFHYVKTKLEFLRKKKSVENQIMLRYDKIHSKIKNS